MHKGSMGDMATPAERCRFERTLRMIGSDGAIITSHDVPDPDALGASYSVARKLARMGKASQIVCGPVTPPVEPLIEKLGMKIHSWNEIPPSDERPVIVLDTNNPALLTGLSGRKNKVVLLIDHHQKNAETVPAAERIENLAAISACEIVASLFRRKDIDGSIAMALAVGIASDSERLNYADLRTIRIFEKLLAISGLKKRNIDELAYPPLRPDILYAVMEDMKTLRVEQYAGRVIAIGRTRLDVPFLFADAARGMGASVAVGISELENSWLRVSIRVRLREAHENGVHASEIASRASEMCRMPENLRGGGHIDKAGALIHSSLERVVNALLASSKEVIDKAGKG